MNKANIVFEKRWFSDYYYNQNIPLEKFQEKRKANNLQDEACQIADIVWG